MGAHPVLGSAHFSYLHGWVGGRRVLVSPVAWGLNAGWQPQCLECCSLHVRSLSGPAAAEQWYAFKHLYYCHVRYMLVARRPKNIEFLPR